MVWTPPGTAAAAPRRITENQSIYTQASKPDPDVHDLMCCCRFETERVYEKKPSALHYTCELCADVPGEG